VNRSAASPSATRCSSSGALVGRSRPRSRRAASSAQISTASAASAAGASSAGGVNVSVMLPALPRQQRRWPAGCGIPE
jgi:hypothetical protein